MAMKLRVVKNTSAMSAAVGIDAQLGPQQSVGFIIDNYSNRWLSVAGGQFFVPPFVIGYAANLYGASPSSIPVRLGAPAGVAQPVTVVNGDVVLSVYDTPVPPYPGSSYQTSRTQSGFLASFQTALVGLSNPTIDLSGFGGLSGGAFFLNSVTLSYDMISKAAAPASSVALELDFDATNTIPVDIVPGTPTMQVMTGAVECRVAGVAGRVRANFQRFGAADEPIIIGLGYTVNS